LLFPILLSAQTTYYISSSGSDAANGTTQSSPWKTLNKIYDVSHEVGGAEGHIEYFHPGDSILFKRGDVFEGEVHNTLFEGTSDSNIVIGAYGTGDKPLFYGDMRGVTWTVVPGHSPIYQAFVGRGTRLNRALQWVGGEWKSLVFGDQREWYWDYDTLFTSLIHEGDWGLSVNGDTLYARMWGDIAIPASRDSIRFHRNCAFYVARGSHDFIIRDLDIRGFNYAVELHGEDAPTGIPNISDAIVRNISARNCFAGAIYTTGTYDCLVDSCVTDSIGNTQIYVRWGTRTKVRHNSVKNTLATIDGVEMDAGNDFAGIGIEGVDQASDWPMGPNNNTIEYNTLENANSIDFWYNNGDTIQYNISNGSIMPHGTDIVIRGNVLTLNGGTGISGTNIGSGVITVTGNTVIGMEGYEYGIAMLNSGTSAWWGSLPGGTIAISNNAIVSHGNSQTNLMTIYSEGTTSITNAFVGPGKYTHIATNYSSLTSFQSSTGLETGSTEGDFYIRPTVTGVGTLTPSYPIAVDSNASYTFTSATPVSMEVDSVATDSTTSYTFTNILRDHTIEVNYSTYDIADATLTAGTVGVAYSQQIAFSSPVTADVRVYIRGIPPGLRLDYTGLLSGTPTQAGTFTATYELRQRFSRVRQTTGAITITVN
jgi:hypothetical protein